MVMRSINRLFTPLLSTLTLLGMAACSKPDVEIVESNYEFTPSEKATSVDKPAPYIFKGGNFVAPKSGQEPLTFLLNGKDGHFAPKGESAQEAIVEVIKGETLSDVSMSVRVSKDKFTSLGLSREGFLELPEGILTFDKTVTIAKGDKSAALHISLPESIEADLKDGSYATVLELVPTGEDFHTAEGLNQIIVKVAVNSLDYLRPNVTMVDEIPAGATRIPSLDFFASANYNDDRTDYVLDGDKSNDTGRTWISGSASSNALTLSFGDEPRMVGYVYIYSPIYQYGSRLYSTGFTRCGVWISDNGGRNFYDMGTMEGIDRGRNEYVIRLDKPVPVTDIRIDRFGIMFREGAFIGEVELYEPISE